MTVNIQHLDRRGECLDKASHGEKRGLASLFKSIGQALALRLTPAEPRARSSAEIMSAVERRKKQYDALWYGHYLPPSF